LCKSVIPWCSFPEGAFEKVEIAYNTQANAKYSVRRRAVAVVVAFAQDESYDASSVRCDGSSNTLTRSRLMKFPGGFNIQQMMKQAQQMQEKMSREMEELRVEASSGGGVVTVQMKGNHEITALKIDPEAVKEDDVEMLQDMILAAINEANRKVDEAMKGKIGGMLPPGLGGLLG
jgi:nucleoid-associated protein EbfC